MADKLCRLSEILNLLKLGRPNVQSLATTFSISPRTVKRDISDLRKLGFIIKFDTKRQRYTMVGSMMIAETRFTLEEALAITTLCLDSGHDIPFLKAAKTAAMKLESVLPKKTLLEVQKMYGSLLIQGPKVNPLTEAQSTFDTMLRATQTLHSIRIWYKSPIEPEFITLLSPYHLFFGRHSWYVIGRSSMHRETRMFHIGRINRFEETENEYEIPKGFSLKQFFGNAWCMIREAGPDQHVVIRFSPLVAQNVAEVSWHETQRVLWNPDGTMDYHVTVSGLHEISWWILGYGKEAEVLRPKKLREIIRGHAEAVLKQY